MANKDHPEQSGNDASNDRNYRGDGTWDAQGADSDDGGMKRPS